MTRVAVALRGVSATPVRVGHDRAARWRRWAPYAAALVGLGLCVVVFRDVDVKRLWAALSRVGAYLPLILLAPLGGLCLHAWAWGMVVPPAARPGAAQLLRAQIVASAGNWLGAGVLGEPTKLAPLRTSDKSRAAKLLAFDNVLQLTAALCFLALGLMGCAEPGSASWVPCRRGALRVSLAGPAWRRASSAGAYSPTSR